MSYRELVQGFAKRPLLEILCRGLAWTFVEILSRAPLYRDVLQRSLAAYRQPFSADLKAVLLLSCSLQLVAFLYPVPFFFGIPTAHCLGSLAGMIYRFNIMFNIFTWAMASMAT